MFTTFFLMITLTAWSQTEISGSVKKENGEPIPFANVLIENTYDGTTADESGKFKFQTEEKDSVTILVRALGFYERRLSMIAKGRSISIEVSLREQVNELSAVTISAGAFVASDESRRTVFRAVDIATTAGATADIAGALNTLPGTQKVGESGRLFVRGGEGNETRTFIDGMVVLDAYSPSGPNAPSRGRFLPFMFKGTSFSTGGYSAEFGQALSSALVLDSKDNSELTRTDIGLLSVGADVTHTQAWKSGSAAAKVQYTDIRPYIDAVEQNIDWKKAPVSIQGIAAFRQKVGKTGMLKLFGNFNESDFSLYNHDIDGQREKQLYRLNNKYEYINASYKSVLNQNWIVKGGFSYTGTRNDNTLDNVSYNEAEHGTHSKLVFEGSITDRVELKAGAEAIARIYSFKSDADNAFDETIGAAFVEADLYASNNFVTRAGLRSEFNSLNGDATLDPRLSFAYKTGSSSQVSFAYGTFTQSVKNEWLRYNTELASEKAQHFILNYQRTSDRKTFRVESYYKIYDDLIKFNNGPDPSFNNGGYGYARGLEFFWRDSESIKNTDYWLSYSFLDTKRNYLNFDESLTPVFSSAHNFSAVGKYFIREINSQLGVTYSFASGRPFNNPNLARMNAGRTPAYHDLSFNWSYLPKPYLIVYLSCTNLTGRDNIFGYEYSDNRNESGVFNSRAIRQPAPRFIFIGIFITLSKEKSVNQLPTL